jgi:hypothetical protein
MLVQNANKTKESIESCDKSAADLRAVFPSRISETALSAVEALLSHRQGCSAFGALDSSRHRALVTFF